MQQPSQTAFTPVPIDYERRCRQIEEAILAAIQRYDDWSICEGDDAAIAEVHRQFCAAIDKLREVL